MKELKIYQVDAFTTALFGGNPAGVVLNADELSVQEMQSIARELNNSETAFISRADGPDHDIRIRYFTPTTEVPVCGHATIAAHYVRARELELAECTVRHKIAPGIFPVQIIKEDGDYTVVITQGRPDFAEPFRGVERDRIVQALGLSGDELDERCPVQIVSTGHSKVLIGIRQRSVLNKLTPDLRALTALSQEIGCNGYFVFTLEAESEEILTHGRMFAPAIGIDEDPVTGNANGPLGAYLVKHGLAEHDGATLAFQGEQGTAIGRSGRVGVLVDMNNGEPERVRISGRAVIVFKTELSL